MKSLLKFILVLLVFGISTALAQPKQKDYLMLSESDYDFNQTVSRLEALLKQNEEINLFAKIDFSKNVQNGLAETSASSLLIFGNPKVETLLMQKNQLAALDLPLKILMYRNEKEVKVAYSNLNYLKSKYNLKRADNLSEIKNALKNLGSKTTGRPVKNSGKFEVKVHEGIISETSEYKFETTYKRLKMLIESHPDFQMYAGIDHFENARRVNLGMRPARLIIFENSKMTAAVTQANIRAALDLPLKFLVWRDEAGLVKISFNDPGFLAKRFGLDEIAQLEFMTLRK